METYYIYQYIDPRTNLIFYIGKGSKDRDRYHLLETLDNTINKRKHIIIQEILSSGLSPVIERIAYFDDEELAYAYEEELIVKYGRKGIDDRGILANITLGSRPPSRKGCKVTFSEEHRKKLSKAAKGRKRESSWSKGLTKETDARVAARAKKRSETGNDHQIGVKRSKQTVQKIKDALTGRSMTIEQRSKMSEAKKGKTWEDIFGTEGAKKRRELSKKYNHFSKKVITPAGEFESVTAARKHHAVAEATVRNRCLSEKFPNWSYVE